MYISNFGESFSNGLAFCALLHHFLPDKIPYSTLTPENQRQNFTIAFEVAEELDIPSLLVSQQLCSIVFYVQFILFLTGYQRHGGDGRP